MSTSDNNRRESHDPDGTRVYTPPRGGETAPIPGKAETGDVSTGDYDAAIAADTVIAGRYRLLERIGEGGMGEVWAAKQTSPVVRKVALKLIKPGMDSRQVLARFEAERQALAMMDHPNIAKVLDAGLTAADRPFFVMELVDGQPLTQFCDAAKLTPRERLELFIPICQAVQHAHQKGVVHRDLKPSNVLVARYDGKAVPKVIDFGVAKATGGKLTDLSLTTQVGAVVGTLEYMAPEQAGATAQDVDTRADVYSLGVILYELLTGLRPFDGARLRKLPLDETMRIIRDEEPPRPSARLAGDSSLSSAAAIRRMEPWRLPAMIRGDLDWIVMKALEKDRGRRYATANGLGRDVQRYLADEPVEAGPPGAGYRARKFVRRNRGRVAVVGAMAAILVSGSAISVWQAVRATRAEAAASEDRDRAVIAEADSARERDRALAAEVATGRERDTAIAERARADDQAALARAVNEFLHDDLLIQAHPGVQSLAERKADPDLKLRTVLDRAAARIGNKFRDRPLVEAAIRQTIGQSYEGLGEYTTAQAYLEASLALFRDHLPPDDPEILDGMDLLGQLYHTQRQLERAEVLLTECFASRKRVFGEKHLSTQHTAASLGGVYLYQGRKKEAEEILLKAIDGGTDDPAQIPLYSLHTANLLACTYRDLREYDKAEVLFKRIIAVAERYRGQDNLHVVSFMHNLATVYTAQKKFANAEALFMKCLDISRTQLTADHPETLWAMYRTAQMYYEQQKFDLAEKYYTDCVDGQNRVLGYSAPNTHRTFLELWNLYSQRRKFPEADALMARQLAGMRRDSATPLGVLAAFLAKSGNQRMQRGDLAVAEAAFRECLAISKKTQPNDWDTFAVQARLGKALLLQKKYEEAETMLLGAYEGLFDRKVSIPAGGRHNLTETILSLVDLYEASGNPAEAAHLLKPQLDALRRDRAADPLAVAAALTRYGRILEQLGLTPAAETALREALALGEKHGPETWATFHAKASLGGLLVGQNNFKAAEPLLLSGYEGMKWCAEKDSSQLNRSASEAVDRLGRLNAAAERLVELFQATNRLAEASKWRAELPAPAPQLAPYPRLVAPTK